MLYYPFWKESDLKSGSPSIYTNKLAEVDVLQIVNEYRQKVEPYADLVNEVAKKIFVEGEWVIVGLKMLCPQNSWSALKDLFCSFVEWKGWRGTWKLNGFLVFCK